MRIYINKNKSNVTCYALKGSKRYAPILHHTPAIVIIIINVYVSVRESVALYEQYLMDCIGASVTLNFS